jgi:hypothetical protein
MSDTELKTGGFKMHKSNGHRFFLNNAEYFTNEVGNLYRAPVHNPIINGYRSGARFETAAHLVDEQIDNIVALNVRVMVIDGLSLDEIREKLEDGGAWSETAKIATLDVFSDFGIDPDTGAAE